MGFKKLVVFLNGRSDCEDINAKSFKVAQKASLPGISMNDGKRNAVLTKNLSFRFAKVMYGGKDIFLLLTQQGQDKSRKIKLKSSLT